MCYSEFNDIIDSVAAMDADVISIETSRSCMELLDAGKEEMLALLRKANAVLAADQLWVNPDCRLKTRGWLETRETRVAMVQAARTMHAAA